MRGDKVAACSIAEKCAPYLHPRLSSVEVDATVQRHPIELTTEELERIAAGAIVEREPAAGIPPEPGRRLN